MIGKVLFWLLLAVGILSILHSQVMAWTGDYEQATYRLLVGAIFVTLALKSPPSRTKP